ncbi:alpha/beta hydrolase [Prosthecomicrobium pneumaticum]|uniref:Putative esterase n=1 Tax=Prosthecomicrobium pneumaticum TaxID=81895 RepID=A0A7W9CVW8_9HYPH|nr:dienelactone hydrolase family protein [Prosthecomicrobium pneumaticum]MBB5752583.1 putative esterase [Prosthecomicrobium pneumaticum]
MTITRTRGPAPHGGRPVLAAGAPLEKARAALILVHGRGSNARDIIGLAPHLDVPDVAFFAPDAGGGVWYPQRFIEPTAANEPYLSAALAVLDGLVADLAAAGVPAERVALAGFSQGACLTLDYAARHARRFGAVAAWSGGLIGAEGEARHDTGDLAGTPVFLGCSDVDFHIPLARVKASSAVMRARGGLVEERIYPGLGHTLTADEIDWLKARLGELAA